jgi:hypothetical protein
MNGYEGLVWVNDNDGKEFVCSLDNNRKSPTKFDDLSEHERGSCRNVNEIVGTERW